MNLSEIFKGRMTQSKWKALGRFLAEDYIRSGPGATVRKIDGRIIIGTTRKPEYLSDTLPPFFPQFGENESGAYATVTGGYVCERIPGTGNALKFHKPDNLVDDDGEPKKFPIKTGQAVYVVVSEDESGKISGGSGTAPVQITVDDDGKESTHYVPKVGDDEYGKTGTRYYKLAVFKGSDADPVSEIVMGGSHIAHFQDLPKFKNADGDIEFFQKYDEDEAAYLIKGLVAGIPFSGGLENLKFENKEKTIEAKVIGGNLDLESYLVTISNSGIVSSASSPDWIASWRNGVFIGIFTESNRVRTYDEAFGQLHIKRINRVENLL